MTRAELGAFCQMSDPNPGAPTQWDQGPRVPAACPDRADAVHLKKSWSVSER